MRWHSQRGTPIVITNPNNMAYSYTQNFNSLSTAALAGQDSWTANGSTACASVSTDSSAIFEGAKGLKWQLGTGGYYYRTITSMTTGSMFVATRVDTNASSGDGFFIFNELDGSNTKYSAAVKWISGASTLQYLKSATWANLATGLSTGTWYIINAEFDTSTDQVRYRYKASGGSWSSFTAWETAYTAGTNVDRLAVGMDTGVYSLDSISDTEPTSSAVKTYNGLATASVKTVNGLAIASVKTKNGLA